MIPRGDLYRVTGWRRGHFVAGLIVRHDRVVFSAPILKKLVGHPFRDVKNYLKFQKWEIRHVGRRDDVKIF
jgi:hypothetical protein